MQVMTDRQGLTSLPPLWWPMGQLRRHTQLIALLRVDDACHRQHVAVLISAVVGQSLCREGRVIRPHYYQLTLGLLEI